MDLVPLHAGVLFESLVMIFQVVGLASLVLARLVPAHRWIGGGKVAFALAMLGLGVAGAICAHHRSSMGLFAGGTMTFLLVGMIAGSHPASKTSSTRRNDAIEPTGVV